MRRVLICFYKAPAIILYIDFLCRTAFSESVSLNSLDRFGVDGSNPLALPTISELRDGWTGVDRVRWDLLEPVPPRNGIHFYAWRTQSSAGIKLRETLNQIRVNGRKPHLTIKIGAKMDWAIEYDPNDLTVYPDDLSQRLPSIFRIKRLPAFKEFLRSLILEVVLGPAQIQIDSEAENVWSSTSAQYYAEAVNAAFDVISEVNASLPENSRILMTIGGFAFSDFFLLSPAEQRMILEMDERVREKLYFVTTFFTYRPRFHRLSLHLSNKYEAIRPTVEWFRSQLQLNSIYSAEIMSEDAASGPDPDPKDPREAPPCPGLELKLAKSIECYHRLQAGYLVKKAVSAFAAGVPQIFLSNDIDHLAAPNIQLIFQHSGLLTSTREKKYAFFSYQRLIEKLDRFSSVTTIKEDKVGVYHYKFFKGRKRTHVLWCKSSCGMVLIGGITSSNAEIISGVPNFETSQFEPSRSVAVYYGMVILSLSDKPIYLEEQ